MNWQSDDERELIARLRQVSPSSEVKKRLRSRILAEVAAGAALGATTGAAVAAKTAVSAGVGAKIAVGVAGGVLLVAVGLYVGFRGSAPSSPPPEAPGPSAVVVRPEQPQLVGSAPAAPPPAVAPSAPPRPAPVLVHGAADAGADLAEELRLLGQAQTAMSAGDFTRGLTVLDAHRQRFPRGALAGERAGLRVVALCRSGAVEAGRAEGRRLLSANPDSTLAARIRTACGL
jgi:hypothetical protein